MRSPDRVRAASFTAARVAEGAGRDKHLAAASGRVRIGHQGDGMNRSSLCTALAAAALLCACHPEGRSDEAENAAANDQVSAEGKAEEGKISLKMPGVDMTLTL